MMRSDTDRDRGGLSQKEIVRGLRETSLKSGDVVLVHSAMRTFGPIEGGAETVVCALLEVLGEGGTLVVPTFMFAHEAEEDPIIDPCNDPSEMGIITETVRLLPGSFSNTAFRHRFSAVGNRARMITEVDPALSPFDLRSCFGIMLALNCQVLICGMTYDVSTSHHCAEFVSEVPYRHTVPLNVKVKLSDGSVVRQDVLDYQPKPGKDGVYYEREPDSGRLGRMLEERNLVGMAAIGNAAVRKFAMRDLIDLALIEAAKDYNIFRMPEGQTEEFTPLKFGNVVASPEMLDGAGRPDVYRWCVIDESKLVMPAR